jgi:spore maturation protein CgeB
MQLVIFGLTLSSSWGNGHATLWRGLVKALAGGRHHVTFFERDVPYYAAHRDLTALPGGELVLYEEWETVRARARRYIADADAVIVTSYCADANAATLLCQDSTRTPLMVFYDLDTPVTLARLRAGETVDYVPTGGLNAFDLVLSYAGGAALASLRDALGARLVFPLYGHVDPDAHRPPPQRQRSFDLSYLGTYAPDRQPALQRLFIEPARRRPALRMELGGSGYPEDFPWTSNISFLRHVPPGEHPAFYGSSRLTLNVTRADMVATGFCPSGRLFEAAACGTPVLSDEWDGMEQFFASGNEILIARTTEDAEAALSLSDGELERIARAARERVLSSHTSAHRASELVALLERAGDRRTGCVAAGPTMQSGQPVAAGGGA